MSPAPRGRRAPRPAGRRSRRRAASRRPTSRARPARGGARGWPSAWPARTGGRPGRRGDRRPRRARGRGADPLEVLAGLLGHQAHGGQLAHAPLARAHRRRSCSAWRARSSRSPPRRSGGCPSRSRPRRGRRSTCPRPCARPRPGAGTGLPCAAPGAARRRAVAGRVGQAQRVRACAPACWPDGSGSLPGPRPARRRARRRAAGGSRMCPARRVVGGAPAGLRDERGAGATPPDTTSRSHSTRRLVAAVQAGDTARARACAPGLEHGAALAQVGDRDDHAAAASSARAASRPRSDVGGDDRARTGARRRARSSRRTPPESITPGRSLPAKTSGCSIDAGREDSRRGAPGAGVALPTGTRPSKHPVPWRMRTSTPASRPAGERAGLLVAAVTSAAARLGPLVGQHDVGAGLAAAIAACRPASPPPTTCTSA
jgi:hypothetical protein